MITLANYNTNISNTENPLPNEGQLVSDMLINVSFKSDSSNQVTGEKPASDIELANSKTQNWMSISFMSCT
jgi:hypothetical protein